MSTRRRFKGPSELLILASLVATAVCALIVLSISGAMCSMAQQWAAYLDTPSMKDYCSRNPGQCWQGLWFPVRWFFFFFLPSDVS